MGDRALGWPPRAVPPGLRRMIYEHRATFDEMDYAQISFFARHFYWLEHATTAWLMEKQIGFAVLSGERGFGLAIVNAQCRYVAPVHLEQTGYWRRTAASSAGSSTSSECAVLLCLTTCTPSSKRCGRRARAWCCAR